MTVQHVVMLDGSEGGAAEGGESSCLSVDFPMPFKEAVDFNMNEGVGPIKDESADLQALQQICFFHISTGGSLFPVSNL